jgi:hypothetical protein
MTANQRVLYLVMGGVALVLLYGLFFSTFIPAPITVRAGLAAGAVSSAGYARWAWRLKLPPSTNWHRSKTFRMVAFAVAGFAVGFYLFAISLPALYTMAAGTPAERHTVVSGWRGYSRHRCAGPEIPDASDFTTKLCLSTRLPVGTTLVLRGEQSPLGFEVKNFAPAPNGAF